MPFNDENRNPNEILEHANYEGLSNKWVSACDLKKGDKVLLSSGKYGIIVRTEIEELKEPEVTYNFEVQDYHTYYVGKEGILVHNTDCGYERVGQWMTEDEYTVFKQTGEIPRSNVLTKGPQGYYRQASVGDFYVEFDIKSSLLVEKDANLGWSLIKSKNAIYIKSYSMRGIPLDPPIGTNIVHVTTKLR